MGKSLKVALTFTEISGRLYQLALPAVDHVVGIGRGGVVPAALVAHQLRLPLSIVAINYRDDANEPRYGEPQLLADRPEVPATAHLLLVDDVAVTGRTLAAAKTHFPSQPITTLVMKGQADFVLFPDLPQCVIWPWRPEPVAAGPERSEGLLDDR